ncbi:MAG: hypothetical protein F6J97_17185 [Leptolyngbya sp. SIO4C1]|nr:hypothetical protein [Leptolyngbya sp. SIO4C1]
MFGTYQQSNIRIEVDAAAEAIRDSLTLPAQLKQWLWPQQFSGQFAARFSAGQTFESTAGPIALHHTVEAVTPNSVRLLLHGSIDGFHEWYWGDGWVQSRLEGISMLPLNLAQTTSLLRLRLFLQRQRAETQLTA